MRVRILVVLVVAVAAVAGASVYLLDQDRPDVTRGGLTVSGDLARDLTVDEYAGIATLTYDLEGDVEWRLMDLTASHMVESEDGIRERGHDKVVSGRTLVLDQPGWYDAILYVDGDRKASGTVILLGDATSSFRWGYADSVHEVAFSYRFSDYMGYVNDPDAVRCASEDLDPSRFAPVDDAIRGLEVSLRSVFSSVYGAVNSASSQDYADFILSFVQSIPGPEGGDMFLNGMDEYWSYPLETLRMGMGDAEDRAFLAASLFAAAGFTSVLATVGPEVHVAVSTDVFAPRDVDGMVLTGKHLDSVGTNLFFCTTSTDVPVPIGYMDMDAYQRIMQLDTVSIVQVGVRQ